MSENHEFRFNPWFHCQTVTYSAQFEKKCKKTAYQKQVQISIENTYIPADFEIISQFQISWRKLV